jgi:membrane protein implicated in regulation of membrane protease activity
MIWWYWLLLGLALLALEAATPGGFFALFFGISAILVGLLSVLGLEIPGWGEWLLFTGLAVASLLFLRRPLKARMELRSRDHAVDSLVGEEGVVTAEIRRREVGKVELRGSVWNARHESEETLPKGRRVQVERVQGLTLWVRPD